MHQTEILSSAQAKAYASAQFINTYYLGYRDLPEIIQKFLKSGHALDYGCGSGRSTRFLKSLGFSVVGVDISEPMLCEAQKEDRFGEYRLIESAHLPFNEASFDCVLSCFVFLTVSTKLELQKIFQELYRVLKPGGLFIFVSGSKYLYSKHYLSYDVSLQGELETQKEISVTLKDLGISFQNYFYSDDDYRELLSTAGFDLAMFHMPVGHQSERLDWKDETLFSPYVVYAAKK